MLVAVILLHVLITLTGQLVTSDLSHSKGATDAGLLQYLKTIFTWCKYTCADISDFTSSILLTLHIPLKCSSVVNYFSILQLTLTLLVRIKFYLLRVLTTYRARSKSIVCCSSSSIVLVKCWQHSLKKTQTKILIIKL